MKVPSRRSHRKGSTPEGPSRVFSKILGKGPVRFQTYFWIPDALDSFP